MHSPDTLRSRRLGRGSVLLRTLLVVLLLAIAAVAGAGYTLREELSRAAVTEGERSFQVAAGASLRSVLGELTRERLVRHPRLLEAWARWHYGARVGLKSGRYAFASGSTPRELIEQMRAGRVVLEQLTLIEGWNFAQFRQAIDAHPTVAHGWRGLTPAAIMKALGQEGLPAEGRFFPDTYRFAAGTADGAVYRMAFERMQRELARAWQERSGSLPLSSPEQLLTFASIVEKETGREDERARVAAVFANRLRIGMRLQSDPTVIYGLGESYDGDIRSRDLVTDTPYNTYTREGLPPTPIAMPGAASLQAAAHPAGDKALYFVATGNGDGSHHFSSTLEEHNAAVARFLRRTRGH